MERAKVHLDQIQVASPCKMAWERMEGDEQVRFCHRCKLNVYNLSAMSRAEAERLVQEREGRLCVRFYRRPDDTLLTRNCPVGKKRHATGGYWQVCWAGCLRLRWDFVII